jgi:ParB family chromosome partitioning protein
MSRRSTISDMIAKQLATANSAPTESARETLAQRVGAGPVRTMGLTLDRIQSEERALREALAAGVSVVEIDVELVMPSFARDRFDADDRDGGALRQSILENGQETPILVRPHPDDAGRFQVAFGHRRLEACRALGRKVRAVVRPLSDADLVIAQGSENAARVDLSFIEKAVFARTLEERGFDRSIIMRALATDKTELSKLISAAKGVPSELIRIIGAAPKTGRRRWMALADALSDKGARERARKAATIAQQNGVESDARFAAALSAAIKAPENISQSANQSWFDAAGREVARAERRKSGLVLSLNSSVEPGFDEFLLSRLDLLLAEFREKDRNLQLREH